MPGGAACAPSSTLSLSLIHILSNVMRDDEVRGSFTQEVALENAPKQEDGSFLIPSILGEGGDR